MMIDKKDILKNTTKLEDILNAYLKDGKIKNINIDFDGYYVLTILINTLHINYYKNTDVNKDLLKNNTSVGNIPPDSKLFKYIKTHQNNIKRRCELYGFKVIDINSYIDKIIIKLSHGEI